MQRLTVNSVFNLRVYSEKSADPFESLPFSVFGLFKDLFATPDLRRYADSRREIALSYRSLSRQWIEAINILRYNQLNYPIQ